MRARWIGLLLALALVGVACNGNDVVEEVPEVPPEAEDVLSVSGESEATVVVQDFFFSPTELRGTPGQALDVELQNIGGADHTFTIDEAGVDVEVAAGTEASTTITFPDAGAAQFYCRFHAGMTGTLSVDGGGPDDDAGSGGGYGYGS